MKAKKADETTEADEIDQLQKRLKEEREKESLRRLTPGCPPSFYGGNLAYQPPARDFSLFRDRRLTDVTDITEIRPYLLLCGALALRGNVLGELGVSCVINATSELPDTPLPCSDQTDVFYLRVGIDDKSDSDILSWLDVVADLIHQVKAASGKTLIHCVAGISRSAALCLAYLVKYEGYSLCESYNMLRALRHIRPNSGFFGQLVEFEKRVTGKQTVLMIRSDRSDQGSARIPHLYQDEYCRFQALRYTRLQMAKP